MGYLGHLAYMSMHAIANNYLDEAYHGYDHAIREKAKEKGLQAFKMGDNGLSLLDFNMDNSKSYGVARKGRMGVVTSKADWSTAGSGGLPLKVKGSCFAFNYSKDGCTREKCSWDHHCLTRRSKSHIAEGCPYKK